MDIEDDAKYPPNGNSYVEDDINEDDDDDDDEEIFIEEFSDDDDDDDDDGCGVQRIAIDDYADNDGDDDDEDYGSSSKHPKKKKLKSLLSSYEFAPRVPAPPPSSALPPSIKSKPLNGKRNPLTDWTERESFRLLDAWGERYLHQGRKSLRLEEWQEVAQKVSKESEFVRTDTQCRNRLDTLKKKYKKEKSKFGDDAEGSNSDWVYFKKMDTLLSSSLPQKYGLSCGVDSGEYVFMNPNVYLNSSNGLDEMRDSPGNSEDETKAEKKNKKQVNGKEDSFKLLADAISKFSSIYERVEESKRQQMVELEKMRMNFYSDLELEKRQIIERARDEFVKIRQGNDRDNDNDSG